MLYSRELKLRNPYTYNYTLVSKDIAIVYTIVTYFESLYSKINLSLVYRLRSILFLECDGNIDKTVLDVDRVSLLATAILPMREKY